MAKKFYVVWRGVKTGVFDDWPTTHALVDGFAGAQYKSFPTLAEAEAAFRSGAPARSTAPQAARQSRASRARTTRMRWRHSTRSSSAMAPANRTRAKRARAWRFTAQGVLASLWYGAYNPAGTNNTAELNALLQALMLAKTEIDADKTVQVRSDSSYGLNAVTKWAAGWKKRGWRKADGEIKNLEIIQELYALYLEIEDDVKLQHVSAHVGIEGNELADRMAMLAVEQRELEWREYDGPLRHRQAPEDARGLTRHHECARASRACAPGQMHQQSENAHHPHDHRARRQVGDHRHARVPRHSCRSRARSRSRAAASAHADRSRPPARSGW